MPLHGAFFLDILMYLRFERDDMKTLKINGINETVNYYSKQS